MEMPNCDRAVVPRKKLTEYLLSTIHPVGKGKAKFFKQFGYDETNVALFEEGLLLEYAVGKSGAHSDRLDHSE
jgi:hypothetical protein